eukprot:TRINITY_DN18493_c0_g1_i2.p1 TRINITY_DN18493_c0_g1~~TRINITY_DN18493_c0_g1_i2.p1  ORF type:complete len:131 (+),score=23.73 TRINITY_DN18493_c0_g1_i2:43-435(+)
MLRRGLQFRFQANAAYLSAVQRTLDAVCDVFDELSDTNERIDDVLPTEGVLELKIKDLGTYVLNKQAPKEELWLSSPISGPSQFAMCIEDDQVVWRVGNRELTSLLETEMSQALTEDIIIPKVKYTAASA